MRHLPITPLSSLILTTLPTLQTAIPSTHLSTKRQDFALPLKVQETSQRTHLSQTLRSSVPLTTQHNKISSSQSFQQPPSKRYLVSSYLISHPQPHPLPHPHTHKRSSKYPPPPSTSTPAPTQSTKSTAIAPTTQAD